MREGEKGVAFGCGQIYHTIIVVVLQHFFGLVVLRIQEGSNQPPERHNSKLQSDVLEDRKEPH